MQPKEVKAFLYTLCSLFLLSITLMAVIAIADDAKPVPDATQVKLLKAQHAVDEAIAKVTNAQIQFSNAAVTQQQISAAFPSLQKQQADAEKALQDVKDEAIKAAGLDKAKFDVDVKAGTFIPKAPTATATPSAPEKK
jgi:hypothetical protein